jgi:tRNA dimethylallyltransferase
MKALAVAIFGPTGVGKTSLSIELAGNNGEIISVDSRQIYKFMDIGTAKPSSQQLEKVNHYLINFITPDIKFSAADFKKNAENLISEILSRNKIPFLVGGTGLYFNALFKGMVDIPPIDKEIQKKLLIELNEKGQPALFKLLEDKDPEYAARIHPNDKQRLLRSLEVIIGTGNKFSSYLKTQNVKNEIQYIKIGINISREILYKRIDQRVDEMISSGFLSEVKKLIELGYDEKSHGMNGIGYFEFLSYLKNKISFDEAVYLIKKNSRNYAKRQLTWFRSYEDAEWFSNEEIENIKIFLDKKFGEYKI